MATNTHAQVQTPLPAQIPPGAKFLATRLKGFGIPFRIDSQDDSFIEVQLYLSEDRGKTWRFHDRKSTDQTEFPFQVNADGEYWFALKTLNRNRQLVPEGKVTQPQLVILVDTVVPELTFQIESDAAGRVECRWKAFDKYLDPKSLQILYQPMDANPDSWTKVPIELNGTARNGSYVDQVAWWPETNTQSLNVRVTIADSAGNLAQQDRRINVAPSPWRHRATATARTGDSVSSGQVMGQPPASNGVTEPTPVFPFPSADRTTQLKPATPTNTNSPPPYGANPNMVCENGVCYPRNSPLQAAQSPIPREIPRIAQAGNQSRHDLSLAIIGSVPEFTAPPVPAGYRTPADARNFQPLPQPSSPNSIAASGPAVPWNSELERWTTRNQSSSSSTLSPDSRVLPLPDNEKSVADQHLPPTNPNQMKTVGNQVIGESSTIGPNNQYRGPAQQTTPNVAPTFTSGTNFDVSNPSGSQGAVTDLVQADQQNWQSGDEQETTPRVADTSTARSGLPDVTPQPNPQSLTSVVTNSDDFDSSLQMIGSKQFRLNYGIDAIDPSGVARVDLWMTRDGGQTWNSWGNDADNTSPFPVEVTEEGRYGFRIVVHSRDGLTGRGPASGDKADIWVHVDTQSPLTQIVSVPYGRGPEAGRLAINYRVADPHLTLRPINISYSSNPDGPWTAIGEGLRNEERFLWKPTSNVPDRIFLRLEARDRAGNVGVHQLSQAIDVSGLVPRGTIHGVVPVGAQ